MCEEDKNAEMPKDIVAELMSAVTYVYLNPTENTADEDGHTQLKLLAEDFGMTPIKVRKILITSGAYQTVTSVHEIIYITVERALRKYKWLRGFRLLQSAVISPTEKPYTI